jgi:high-affinity nickel-transport protein
VNWRRISLFGGAVAVLHVAGWGLLAYYARTSPGLFGLGTLAYTFGLRHAFDADHIAAIDNTTRKFLQDGRKSLGVGFFFALGHSSVVLILAIGMAAATATVQGGMPSFQHWGAPVGTALSATFLLALGVLNLMVLGDVIRLVREMRHNGLDEARLEARLLDRGLMSRSILKRVGDRIHSSWQMFPLGVLFGLGFETATEIGLLALSAEAAGRHVPFAAVVALPLLFAAGMTLFDTADGAFMAHAYSWAFSSPVRKLYYNITVTSLSVAVALGIGGIEAVQLVFHAAWLDISRLGYAIVALFLFTWTISAVIWRTRRIEERWGYVYVRRPS